MTLTRHGAATAPDGQSCNGPLASHVGGFAAQLSRKGYAQNTVRAKCDVLADLSRWLERHQLTLAALDEGRLRQFQPTRRRRDKARRGRNRALYIMAVMESYP
jgi:site-specific recombinase XerD